MFGTEGSERDPEVQFWMFVHAVCFLQMGECGFGGVLSVRESIRNVDLPTRERLLH
jgi:hypothetical protein